jgi:hypothetical protein
MNLFPSVVRNVTVLARLESIHRFKTLLLEVKWVRCFRVREVVSTGAQVESFSLREIRHAVSLTVFAASTALETSAV